MDTEELSFYSEAADLSSASIPDTECESINIIIEPVTTNNKNKLYYSISEVSSIIGEKQHTIRYWSKHFSALKSHSRNSRRYYTAKQLEIFQTVKTLIRKKNLTLAGAKKTLPNYLKQNKISYLSTDTTSSATNITKDNNKNTKQIDISTEDNIIFTKEEFVELLEVLQLLMLYIKTKT